MSLFPRQTLTSSLPFAAPAFGSRKLNDPDYEHLDIADPSEEEDVGFFEDIGTGVLSGLEGFGRSLIGVADMVLGDALPEEWEKRTLERPEGLAGVLAEGFTQFAAGLIPGLGAVGAISKLGRAATAIKFGEKTTKLAKGYTAGAIADFVAFDGHEERLSDLLADHTEFLKPVTEYLQSDQSDSEFEGRMKNVIEGSLVGGAITGLISGTKLLKAMKNFDGSPVAKANLENAKTAIEEEQIASGTYTRKGLEQAKRVEELVKESDPEELVKEVPGNPVKEDPVKAAKKTFEEPIAPEAPRDSAKSADLPESISGPAAIYANSRITSALMGADTAEELDDMFKSFVPELMAKEKRTTEKIAAEMLQRTRVMGMDTTPIETFIKSGGLDRPGSAQDFVRINIEQQLAFAGVKVVNEQLDLLSQSYVKLQADGATRLELDEMKLKIVQAENRHKRYTLKHATIGTGASDLMRSRQGKNIVDLQNRLDVDKLVDEANTLDDSQYLATEMSNTRLKATDEAASDILDDTDDILDPETVKPSKDKQEKIADKRQQEIERLEKQLEARRKRTARINDMDPDEIRNMTDEQKAKLDEDPEILALKEKIAYHDEALRDEQSIISLREEEHYVDTMSNADYKKRVNERKAQLDRTKKFRDELKPGKANSAVKQLQALVKSKGQRKLKLADAQELLDETRRKLLNGDEASKTKPLPDDIKTDPELKVILDKIKSNRDMLKEENDIQDLIKDFQALSKLTDRQFVNMQALQKNRNSLLKQTKKTRLQELRKQRKEYIEKRKEAMAVTGRGFTTKKNFDKWLKSRFGNMEKGFDTYVKRRLFAIENETGVDQLQIAKKISEMSLYDKFTNFGVRLFQSNLLSGPATVTLNVAMPLAVRFLKRAERIVGSGIGALRGDAAQQQVFKESLKFHTDMEDVARAWAVGTKGASTRTDAFTGGKNPFNEGNDVLIDAADPRVLGMEQDSAPGKVMGWFNWAMNLPFALNAGGDSMNKALAGYTRLRQQLRSHAYTDKNWVNKPVDAKEAWIKKSLDQAINKDGSLYTESRILKDFSKQARENILNAPNSRELMQDDLGFANEFASVTRQNRDRLIEDQDVLKAIEETKEYVREVTFTKVDQGEIVGMVNRMRQKFAPLNLILPFVNTPAQILSFGLKRTPMGFAYDQIAPRLTGKAKMRRAEYEAMNPMQKAEYSGRMATATAGSAALFYFAYLNRDRITGSGPRNPDEVKALRATGWQPNSFVMGDEDNPTYISYQRLDPFATMIGIAADVADYMSMNPEMEPESSEAISALMFTVAESITDKSFLRGFNNALNFVQQPEIYGPKTLRDIGSGLAVPMFVNQVKDIGESEVLIRESRSLTDAILRKMPFTDEMIPPKRTFLGEAIYKQNPLGLLGVMNPVYISSTKNDIVDKTIQELVHGFGMPSTNFTNNDETNMREFYNVEGRQAYDRYLELTSTTEIEGRNLRSALKGLIKSRGFKNLTQAIEEQGGVGQLEEQDPRVKVINRVLSAYRAKAKREMIGEFPELLKTIQDINLKKQQLRNPIPTL